MYAGKEIVANRAVLGGHFPTVKVKIGKNNEKEGIRKK